MWQSCALVFISSACTLVIELIAGRIMAPYVGVSLYTWTSIIGIVLAGMSVGNYLGGRLASLYESLPLETLFGAVGLFAICAGLLLALFVKPMVRLMAGVR